MKQISLFSLINYARFLHINAEDALEKTNKKFIRRFQYIEAQAQLGNFLAQAQDLGNLGLVALLQGNFATARDYLERSAAFYQSMGLSLPLELQVGLAVLDAQQKDSQ